MYMTQLPFWGATQGPATFFPTGLTPGLGYAPAPIAGAGTRGYISPDQDLEQFPPWVWPYIRPQAIADHLTQILYSLVIQKHLGALYADQRAGAQVVRSADITEDFVCGTIPRIPFPRPPLGHEWVDTFAWQLTLNNLSVLASQFAEGSLKSDLEKLAGTIGKQLKHAEKQLQTT